MRRTVFTLVFVMVAGLVGATATGTAWAQDVPVSQVASQLASAGRYLEYDETNAIGQALDRANERGVAFAGISGDADAEVLAGQLLDRLEAGGSRYRTVLVVSGSGVGYQSGTLSRAQLLTADDASFTSFQNGAIADGLDQFVAALAGQTTGTTTAPSSSSSSSSGGGSSILGPVLLVVVLGGGGLLLIRSVRKRGRAKQLAAAELETDRNEIKEQLRDNADRVLSLGDRVIASKDNELISTYEQASAAYQEVSMAIDGATTAQEVDALDDKIDQSEWQLQMIEARLDGQPVPPSPAEIEARAAATAAAAAGAGAAAATNASPQAPGTGPALGPNDSVLGGRGGFPTGPSYQQPRRGGTGGMGGGLGSILGSIVLGGMGRGGMGGLGMPTSRRGQRRQASGGVFGGGSTGGGGLGGGVLRPSGSGSKRRSSGGRSFGSRSGGGRKF